MQKWLKQIYWKLNPWHAQRVFERELKKAYLPAIKAQLEQDSSVLLRYIEKQMIKDA